MTADPIFDWKPHKNGSRCWVGDRRFGYVIPDRKYPGMWRAITTTGKPSDIANLTRARDAVMRAAALELDYEARESLGNRGSFSDQIVPGESVEGVRYPYSAPSLSIAPSSA